MKKNAAAATEMQAVLRNPERRPPFVATEMEDLAFREVSSEVDGEDEALTDNDRKDEGERRRDGGGYRKDREETGLDNAGGRWLTEISC